MFRSRRITLPLALGFLLLGTAACAVFTQSRRPLQDHMEGHFQEMDRIRMAVIDGELEAVRDPARAIWIQADHPDLPRGVDSPVHDVRRWARRAGDAATLEEAARSVGELGAACARCHRAAQAGPVPTGGLAPAASSTEEWMGRHQWATDQMWVGVLGGDDAAWRAGADALAAGPLVPESCAGCDELEKRAREVRDLGAEARSVHQQGARAGLYGRLIATCAGCHRETGRPGSLTR